MANKPAQPEPEIITGVSRSQWEALVTVVQRLETDPPLWVVTGSMAFALQGLPMTPKDLDLQTDAQGAYEIERRFAPHSTRPVDYAVAEMIRSHYGAFVLNGIDVEIMGAVQRRLPDGGWTSTPDLAKLRRTIEIEEFSVPVMPLAYEAEAYAQMGRTDRSQELLSWRGA